MAEENKEGKPQGEEPYAPVHSISLTKGGGAVKGIEETFKPNPFTLAFMAKSLSDVPPPRIFVPPALAKSIPFYLKCQGIVNMAVWRLRINQMTQY